MRMLKSVRAGKCPKGIHVQDLAEALQDLRKQVRGHKTSGAKRTVALKRAKK
jgi:hypothetical protein